MHLWASYLELCLKMQARQLKLTQKPITLQPLLRYNHTTPDNDGRKNVATY